MIKVPMKKHAACCFMNAQTISYAYWCTDDKDRKEAAKVQLASREQPCILSQERVLVIHVLSCMMIEAAQPQKQTSSMSAQAKFRCMTKVILPMVI